jgi:hypothetical protein
MSSKVRKVLWPGVFPNLVTILKMSLESNFVIILIFNIGQKVVLVINKCSGCSYFGYFYEAMQSKYET